MIIIGAKDQTHYVNEKSFDTISHYIDKCAVVCQKDDGKYRLEFYGVLNVTYVPDASTEISVSGYDPRENS